jgi:hypothetical protein
MSLSNHQKHDFYSIAKKHRRDKSWVKAKDYINKVNRHAKWNGDQFLPLSSDVGRFESVRHIEIGGQV